MIRSCLTLTSVILLLAAATWAADSPSANPHNVSVTGVLTVSNGMFVTGTVYVSGTVSATAFVGNGAGLTNLPGGLGFTTSSEVSVTAAASVSAVHGCGAPPKIVSVEITNAIAELGFTIGQVVQVPPYAGQGTNIGYVVASDNTSTTVKLGSASTPLAVNNLGNGNSSAITNADWTFHLRVGC